MSVSPTIAGLPAHHRPQGPIDFYLDSEDAICECQK
jgi:hypothetical protein